MKGRIRRMLREHAMTHGINSPNFKTNNARKPQQHLLSTTAIANVLGFSETDVRAAVNQMEGDGSIETLDAGNGTVLICEKILAPAQSDPSSID